MHNFSDRILTKSHFIVLVMALALFLSACGGGKNKDLSNTQVIEEPQLVADDSEPVTEVPPVVNVDPEPDTEVPPVVIVDPEPDTEVPPVVIIDPNPDTELPPVVIVDPDPDTEVPPVVIVDPEPVNPITGDSNESVEQNIPRKVFEFREQDYRDDHPSFAGMFISFNTLAIVFELGTSTEDANALLNDIQAEIVAGHPGIRSQVEGILFVQVPSQTHTEMDALIESLRANEIVKVAVQDSLLKTPETTSENQSSPKPSKLAARTTSTDPVLNEWTWESIPTGGNWGLELSRVPQMWGLNDAIEKSGIRTSVGVIDSGFADSHEDLSYINLTPNNEGSHGTHVAGIIGATFNNDKGIDGIDPYSELTVKTRIPSFASIIFDIVSFPQSKVINISLGYSTNVDTNQDINHKNLAYAQGEIVDTLIKSLWGNPTERPIIVVSAGNRSNKLLDGGSAYILQLAKYNSPFANAALEHGTENIIVVEALDHDLSATGGAKRRSSSNIYGSISAPGEDILSTVISGYEKESGTSMAAPHVTGIISYLYSIDPSLTHGDIKQLIFDNSIPVADGASNRIDAFASAMDIDRINDDTKVLKMLVDIDDGTIDGNQRVDYKIGTDFLADEKGDGEVDMSDYRRWRDWYYQYLALPADADLDGSQTHPKKDLNGDGKVDALDNPYPNLVAYPRGDFNGDGKLSISEAVPVAGVMAGRGAVTDLDVFKELFVDRDFVYSADDLDELLNSSDFTVEYTCASEPFTSVEIEVVADDSVYSQSRFIETEETTGKTIFTLPHDIEAAFVNYTADIKLLNADGILIFQDSKSFKAESVGEDNYWNPDCDGDGRWGDAEIISDSNLENFNNNDLQIKFDSNDDALVVVTHDGKFRSSRFDGTSWGNLEQHIFSEDNFSAFQIDFDPNGNALALWQRRDSDYISSIWSSRFDGTNWSNPELLENNDTVSAYNPKMVIDNNGNIFVVWSQSDGVYGSRDSVIWTKHFDGSEWGNAISIGTGHMSEYPQIATDQQGKVIVMWGQFDGSSIQEPTNIWVNQFDGTSWGGPEIIDSGDSKYRRFPQIAMDENGNALVVWSQHRNSGYAVDGSDGVWVNRFDGTSWSNAERISTTLNTIVITPQIAINSSGKAIIVWAQLDDGVFSNWANHFDDNNWEGAELISTSNYHIVQPQVTLDQNGNAFVIWHQKIEGIYSIWTKRFDGDNWGITENIINDVDFMSTKIAINHNGNAFVVWSKLNGTGRDILVKRYE